MTLQFVCHKTTKPFTQRLLGIFQWQMEAEASEMPEVASKLFDARTKTMTDWRAKGGPESGGVV